MRALPPGLRQSPGLQPRTQERIRNRPTTRRKARRILRVERRAKALVSPVAAHEKLSMFNLATTRPPAMRIRSTVASATGTNS
jgi:hypothetical protein